MQSESVAPADKRHPIDNIDCEACWSNLGDYVRLELAGQPADEVYPQMATYIETNEAFESAYYREFRRQGQRKSLAELQQVGQRPPQVADALEQILQTAQPPVPEWYERVLDYGRAWLEKETDRWRQLQLSFGCLLSAPPLGNSQATAPAMAGLLNDAHTPSLSDQETLTVAPDGAHFEMKLVVTSTPRPTDETLCRVDIVLTLKDRFGDFSGVQITLSWGSDVYKKETDTLGKVSFPDLPEEALAFMRLMVVLPP